MVTHDTLRFLEAENVETPSGRLNEFTLVSRSDSKLGTLDGVILSPSERQVRFYVVASRERMTTRHYLMPATPAELQAERHALRVDMEPSELTCLPETEPGDFAAFSEMDAIDAMFARKSA